MGGNARLPNYQSSLTTAASSALVPHSAQAAQARCNEIATNMSKSLSNTLAQDQPSTLNNMLKQRSRGFATEAISSQTSSAVEATASVRASRKNFQVDGVGCWV